MLCTLTFIGAVILGTQQIDANWWQGQIGSHEGIFPVTHVIELEIPPTLKERSRSVRSTEPLFALALCDSAAQLDEELGFKTGDIITVTEILDADWYYGELGGKKGMFLSSCVELIQDTSHDSSSLPAQSNTKPSSKIQKSFSLDQSYYSSVCDPQPKEVSSDQSDSHYVPSDQSQSPDQSANFTSENTKSLDSCVSPYAMTLYPFEGQSDNELSFDTNEIVYLIQHIDDQWTEGEIDGRIGLFPTCFVSIIVDCPYAFNESDLINSTEGNALEEHCQQSDKEEEKKHEDLDINENRNSSTVNVTSDLKEKLDNSSAVSGEHGATKEEEESVFALVLYSFTAESDQDLSVTEGDTVQIIEHVNAEWVRARDENTGKSGLVPSAFLDIISGSPIQLKVEGDRNSEYEVSLNDSEQIYLPQGHGTSVDKMEVKINDSSKNGSDQQVKPGVSASASVTESKKVAHETTNHNLHTDNKKEAYPPHSFNFTLEQRSVLPVKPQLSPKPMIMPKPSLSPKPLLPDKMKLQPVKEVSNNEATMLKSSSAQVLHHNESNNTLQKCYSNSELSSPATLKTENRRATFSFGDVDASKSLNDLISGELSKAKSDGRPNVTEQKRANVPAQPIRPVLQRGQISSQSFDNSSDVNKATDSKRHSVNFPLHNQTAQQYTTNDDFMGNFSTGNSIFFVDPVPSGKSHPPMRKPPPIPQRSFEQTSEFDRKPSLRKAPPPRPMGPRLALAPPTEPLVPVRVTESKHTDQVPRVRPSRPAPTRPAPTSPAVTRPVPTRPAPSRPQGPPAKVAPPEELITLDDEVKGKSQYVSYSTAAVWLALDFPLFSLCFFGQDTGSSRLLFSVMFLVSVEFFPPIYLDCFVKLHRNTS